jgi:hypothetical protein
LLIMLAHAAHAVDIIQPHDHRFRPRLQSRHTRPLQNSRVAGGIHQHLPEADRQAARPVALIRARYHRPADIDVLRCRHGRCHLLPGAGRQRAKPEKYPIKYQGMAEVAPPKSPMPWHRGDMTVRDHTSA